MLISQVSDMSQAPSSSSVTLKSGNYCTTTVSETCGTKVKLTPERKLSRYFCQRIVSGEIRVVV